MSRILVADDNSNIQKMVALALKDQGIEVVAVGNGEAAIRKFAEVKPDLVLADIFMPVRNGYEVCESVKRDPRTAKVPVVLLVGAFDPFDEKEAQRVGADGVLKKPFVPPEPLIAMVTGLLEGLAAHQPAGERTVPVETPEPALVASAAQGGAPFLVEPAVEASGGEEEFVSPSRVEFGGGEQPLAFGELLGSAGAVAEPETEIPTNTHTGVVQPHAWEGPPEVATPGEQEKEAPNWRRGESLLPKREEVKLPRMMAAEQNQALDTAAAGDAETSQASWQPIVPPTWGEPTSGEAYAVEGSHLSKAKLDTVASYPESVPGANGSAGEALAEDPATEKNQATSPVDYGPSPRPQDAKPAASEIVSGHLKEMAEKLFREASSVWTGTQAPVQESPIDVAASVPAVVENAAKPPAPVKIPERVVETHPPVQSFSVPTMPSPQAIEEVVERVMERLQPQIMEVVRKEILRPVVEALVRRELEKKS